MPTEKDLSTQKLKKIPKIQECMIMPVIPYCIRDVDLSEKQETVSYTHLDVYKRQASSDVDLCNNQCEANTLHSH